MILRKTIWFLHILNSYAKTLKEEFRTNQVTGLIGSHSLLPYSAATSIGLVSYNGLSLFTIKLATEPFYINLTWSLSDCPSATCDTRTAFIKMQTNVPA
jgi:hypothetical protein